MRTRVLLAFLFVLLLSCTLVADAANPTSLPKSRKSTAAPKKPTSSSTGAAKPKAGNDRVLPPSSRPTVADAAASVASAYPSSSAPLAAATAGVVSASSVRAAPTGKASPTPPRRTVKIGGQSGRQAVPQSSALPAAASAATSSLTARFALPPNEAVVTESAGGEDSSTATDVSAAAESSTAEVALDGSTAEESAAVAVENPMVTEESSSGEGGNSAEQEEAGSSAGASEEGEGGSSGAEASEEQSASSAEEAESSSSAVSASSSLSAPISAPPSSSIAGTAPSSSRNRAKPVASGCTNCSRSAAYMADDTTDRFNVSLLLIGNEFLSHNSMPTALLPTLYDAASLTLHVDALLNDSFPLFTLSPSTEPSHASPGSVTRATLSTHMYHHIIVQDRLTRPFFATLRSPYVHALFSLWNVTCPMARVHLLSPPLPCAVPVGECLKDQDKGDVEDWTDSGMSYGAVLNAWTNPWFKAVSAGLKEAVGTNRSKKIEVMPLGAAFVRAEDDEAEDEEGWLEGLYEEGAEGSAVLSLKGSYLAACMIFAATTGRSPVGAPAPEMLLDAGVSGDDVRGIQQRVADTLNGWWQYNGKVLTALDGAVISSKSSPKEEEEEEKEEGSAVEASSTAESVQASSTAEVNPDFTPEHQEQMKKQEEIEKANASLLAERAAAAKKAQSSSSSAAALPIRSSLDPLREEEEFPNETEDPMESSPGAGALPPRTQPAGPSQPAMTTPMYDYGGQEDPMETATTDPSTTQSISDRLAAIPIAYVLYGLLGVTVLAAVLWVWSCVKAQWTQKQLRKRRGYDDGELVDFPKESTAGYAFDDGL